jgi:branched-chain amino acid transport system ATP-binding protein
MVAIARGLMAQPRLLLLDEPSVGLAPKLVRGIADAIAEIAESLGVGVILVEQNAQLALRVASRAYVLDLGRVTMAGEASELMRDDRVRAAYLSA